MGPEGTNQGETLGWEPTDTTCTARASAGSEHTDRGPVKLPASCKHSRGHHEAVPSLPGLASGWGELVPEGLPTRRNREPEGG